jgi:hypothetical protein
MARCLRPRSKQWGRAATSEAFPFSRPRWFHRRPRCTHRPKSMVAPLRTEPWAPRKHRATAALGGVLALGAALAAALGSRMAPPFFAATVAIALAADALLSALAASGARGRRRLAFAWLPLAAGWLAFALLIADMPLAYPDGLRTLITALIGGEAVLRVLGSRAATPADAGCGPLTIFCAAAAIAVTWFGGSPMLEANSVAAMATAVSFELLGTGSCWLASAWRAHSARRSAREAPASTLRLEPRLAQGNWT